VNKRHVAPWGAQMRRGRNNVLRMNKEPLPNPFLRRAPQFSPDQSSAYRCELTLAACTIDPSGPLPELCVSHYLPARISSCPVAIKS